MYIKKNTRTVFGKAKYECIYTEGKLALARDAQTCEGKINSLRQALLQNVLAVCLAPLYCRVLQGSSVHLIILQVKIILTHFSSNPVFPCLVLKKIPGHRPQERENYAIHLPQVTFCYLSKYKQMSPCRYHLGSGHPSLSSPC